jgi:hypothetical protein
MSLCRMYSGHVACPACKRGPTTTDFATFDKRVSWSTRMPCDTKDAGRSACIPMIRVWTALSAGNRSQPLMLQRSRNCQTSSSGHVWQKTQSHETREEQETLAAQVTNNEDWIAYIRTNITQALTVPARQRCRMYTF